MWTQKFCLICIYILCNYAFQISNEALFLSFLQPVANRLKSFILPSNRMGKTSSTSTFSTQPQYSSACNLIQWHKQPTMYDSVSSGAILALRHFRYSRISADIILSADIIGLVCRQQSYLKVPHKVVQMKVSMSYVRHRYTQTREDCVGRE